ncbi:MAG: M48 family metalloprotease [Candidatus Marinimicrobia bacterium]|nr:M48 family metalloprotease [Candidatus Neomarinimicrobiota bacterium]
MFTDIAGYTASMSKSESKSLDLLEKKRSILKPLIKEYNGTFVKEIGDGTLSYFESAVNASTCAVKLQEHEFEADKYSAMTLKNTSHMILGLKNLTVQNLGNLTPHPFPVFLSYSHPPVLDRIRALNKLEF